MSNTRHASDGEFHQERFASADSLGRGLLANLVARRCELAYPELSPEDLNLIWSLQLASHRQGLAKLCTDLVAGNLERIGTPAMRRFGMGPQQVYTPEQVKAVRAELSNGRDFPLAGEQTVTEKLLIAQGLKYEDEVRHPQNYPARSFLDVPAMTSEMLPKLLARLCTDPACTIAECKPWYFETLIESLRRHFESAMAVIRDKTFVTRIGREIYSQLDDCLELGWFMQIEGDPGTGMSFAAKAWCDMHPGQARYVAVPSSNDDISFFRSIAAGIGSASGFSMKGVQLRERIEATLPISKHLIVFDNAGYLWPQNNRREALPNRLNWILGLVANGVPAVILTTPQFAIDQGIIQAKTKWLNEQFRSRLNRYKRLSSTLTKEDLISLVRQRLGNATEDAVTMLVCFAHVSGRNHQAVQVVGSRAAYLAKREGRSEIIAKDVASALEDGLPNLGTPRATAKEKADRSDNGWKMPNSRN